MPLEVKIGTGSCVDEIAQNGERKYMRDSKRLAVTSVCIREVGVGGV